MIKQIILTFLLVTLNVFSVTSQTIVGDEPDIINYKLKVKQIDEFMKRFNMKEIPLLFQRGDSIQQKQYNLTALFDYNIIKSRKQDVKDFVSTCLEHNIRIAFTDTTWKAIAHCNATYKGKTTEITLELRTQKVKDYIYKWVITGAHGKILELKPIKENPGLAISPVSNEVNFISLSHITSIEAANILNYKGKNTQLDELSVFFALVKSKQLSINHVSNLEYEFTIAPYYKFKVRNFIREAMNSGWLIADFNNL